MMGRLQDKVTVVTGAGNGMAGQQHYASQKRVRQ